MILITGMLDKTSANILDMYHLIAYIIGPKQQHDDAWKGSETELLFLNTGVPLATFHNVGKVPYLHIRRNNIVIGYESSR